MVSGTCLVSKIGYKILNNQMEEEFFPPEENDFDYQVNLSIEDIHLLHYCVLKRIETWEGSPSRHPTEQQHLWYLRDSLYRMILEYKFENM